MKALKSSMRSLELEGQRVEFALSTSRPGPVIVLLAGAGGPVTSWYRVWPGLAALAPVLAIERPGMGRSSPPQRAQTSAEVVRWQRQVLQALGLAPPWLLVGHSLAGLHVQHWIRAHPNEVMGAALLESTSAQEVLQRERLMGYGQRWAQALLDRLTRPDPLGEVAQADASARSLLTAGPFAPLPLRVLSGARPALRWFTPAAQRALRAAEQRALAALSPSGVQWMAQRSGHFPQFSEPQRVIELIRELLAGMSLPDFPHSNSTRFGAPSS